VLRTSERCIDRFDDLSIIAGSVTFDADAAKDRTGAPSERRNESSTLDRAALHFLEDALVFKPFLFSIPIAPFV